MTETRMECAVNWQESYREEQLKLALAKGKLFTVVVDIGDYSGAYPFFTGKTESQALDAWQWEDGGAHSAKRAVMIRTGNARAVAIDTQL